MAIALQIATRDVWAPLAPEEKSQVARWFATCRGSGIVNNNHLFMSVHILEFLGQHGYAHRTDRAVIDAHLNQLETMHRGGGWFEDGINQAFDHYNAYAFHFYGLMWARLYGAREGTFSTVLGFFLNNEPYGGVFERELAHAKPRALVDFAFHFSTASELHLQELDRYVRDVVNAWASIMQPPGWTPEKTERLRQVIDEIENRSPVQLLAIGIGHDVTRYYKRAVTIVDADILTVEGGTGASGARRYRRTRFIGRPPGRGARA